MTNQLVQNMARDLKKAASKNKAPIWSKMAKLAQKPAIARRVINVKKLNQLTSDGDVVIVPGKVLGTGSISHKITLCSFSISASAAKKIIASGGSIINHSEITSRFPTGKGVKVIG